MLLGVRISYSLFFKKTMGKQIKSKDRVADHGEDIRC